MATHPNFVFSYRPPQEVFEEPELANHFNIAEQRDLAADAEYVFARLPVSKPAEQRYLDWLLGLIRSGFFKQFREPYTGRYPWDYADRRILLYRLLFGGPFEILSKDKSVAAAAHKDLAAVTQALHDGKEKLPDGNVFKFKDISGRLIKLVFGFYVHNCYNAYFASAHKTRKQRDDDDDDDVVIVDSEAAAAPQAASALPPNPK